MAAGGGPLALLSSRTRLTLRVPRERAADARGAGGRRARRSAAATLRLGAPQPRELRPLQHAVRPPGGGRR
ncbi:MAG: hypothetical protein MZV65_15280 [Chromatiales bacterium]|nr:hypothetical protein [Chromatiales bacterium]